MPRHAVFATAKLQVSDPRARGGIRVEPVCFRIGQPTDLTTAHARHDRVAGTGSTFKRGRVRHARRWYPIAFYEVRSVDRHGRGLGSERHATAIPTPYRAHKS